MRVAVMGTDGTDGYFGGLLARLTPFSSPL